MLNNNQNNCQKIISATVENTDDKNNITLFIDAGCSSCTCSCLMAESPKKIKVFSTKKYSKGDNVSLAVDERYMLKLSFLLYGLPLVIMFAVAVVIDMLFHKDNITAVSACLSLIFSWVVLKYISKGLKKSPVKILE